MSWLQLREIVTDDVLQIARDGHVVERVERPVGVLGVSIGIRKGRQVAQTETFCLSDRLAGIVAFEIDADLIAEIDYSASPETLAEEFA